MFLGLGWGQRLTILMDATSSPSATNTAISSPELVNVLGAMPGDVEG